MEVVLMAEERTFAFTNGDILVENVPYAAGEAPTAAEFKALIDAFINAGIMAPDVYKRQVLPPPPPDYEAGRQCAPTAGGR